MNITYYYDVGINGKIKDRVCAHTYRLRPSGRFHRYAGGGGEAGGMMRRFQYALSSTVVVVVL